MGLTLGFHGQDISYKIHSFINSFILSFIHDLLSNSSWTRLIECITKIARNAKALLRQPFFDHKGNLCFEPLQVSANKVKKALQIFLLGSRGGLDELTAQHMKDLLAGVSDDKLLSSITQLINLMLAESFPPDVNKIIFGGCLTALEKKDGGVRPIDTGYLIRRLTAKCANCHVIQRRSPEEVSKQSS